MRIISGNNTGIYYYKCENNSIEEFIIKIFIEKINRLPIAQNILIINKETSNEEIQSFLYRSILCNYNTLFIIGIKNSLTEYQKNLIIKYLNLLLSYKAQKYDEEMEENSSSNEFRINIDSLLIFTYEDEEKNIDSFLKEIKNYNVLEFKKYKKSKIESDKFKISDKVQNIKVITSDICCLWKTEKIKKEIMFSEKKYIYFP